ncbi:uncharacterized protein LOC127525927 [Erpetoichthys calabaricus]|uniref:uncharacterized protein LOC127525927 n=1 Tax=Erpetoichthys calabaricus TaxID=27687 RepID=UPI00223411CE|nr:uncharacterized protein LOC127525927 [Erpetoichthys calabaricus]
MKKEMGPATESLILNGNKLLLVAQKLSIEPQFQEHREELIVVTQNILLDTQKILLLEDDAMIRRIVRAAHHLLESLIQIESARDVTTLSKLLNEFSKSLILLNDLLNSRVSDLIDHMKQMHLTNFSARLKKCISMLYTATHGCIKHPQDPEMQAAKKYITYQIQTAIFSIISFINTDSSPQNKAGFYTQTINVLCQLLSRQILSPIKDCHFDILVRNLVFQCMGLASASREQSQLTLVQHCQRLLQHRAKIMIQIKLLENNADTNIQESLYNHYKAMKHELMNLKRSMGTAVIYQILDAFKYIEEPLNELLRSVIAQSPDAKSFNKKTDFHLCQESFHSHANRILQVAGSVLAISDDIKNIQDIESSIVCLNQRKDDIIVCLSALGTNSFCSDFLQKLDTLSQQWNDETKQLKRSIYNIFDIREIIDLSVSELTNVKSQCEEAFKCKDVQLLHKQTTLLIRHVDHMIEAIKGYIDKSNDPIFRNGLLVLLKQVEILMYSVNQNTHNCLENMSNPHKLETFSEKILQLIKSIHILRNGLDGANHPDILSPLRDDIRLLKSSKMTSFGERKSVLNSEQRTAQQTTYSQRFQTISGKEHCLLKLNQIFPEHLEGAQSKQDIDFLPLIHTIFVAIQKKSWHELQTACIHFQECSSCYTEAAKEAIALTEGLEKEKLQLLRSKLLFALPELVKCAQEITINPGLDICRIYMQATLCSDLISEIKKILLCTFGGWHYAICTAIVNRSEGCAGQVLEDIKEIMLSFSEITESICSNMFSITGSKLTQKCAVNMQLSLKKAQINYDLLCTKVKTSLKDPSCLKAKCDAFSVLWCVSIKVLLIEIDCLLVGEMVPILQKTIMQEFFCHKTLRTISENSLRIHHAAKLSIFCCKDNILNKTIQNLQEEVNIYTEDFIQLAQTITATPTFSIKVLAKAEILQRQLALKTQKLTTLTGTVNSQYIDSIRDVVYLAYARSNTPSNSEETRDEFEKAASVFMKRIMTVQENIKVSLYYIKNKRLQSILNLTTEHLVLITSEIISKSRTVTDKTCVTDVQRLEILIQEWGAKANYILTHLQAIKEINKETTNLIRQDLCSKSKVETHFKYANIQQQSEAKITNAEQHNNLKLDQKKSTLPVDHTAQEAESKKAHCSSHSIQSLAEAALFLKSTTETWEEENNHIVLIIKDMSNQMYHMTQFLKKKGPLKNKAELTIAAKQIAQCGEAIGKFTSIIADHSLDRHCAKELQSIADQIYNTASQLNIISRVNAATPACSSSYEIIVKNAQNMIKTVLQSLNAVETACIKGLKQPHPNTDEAKAASLCIQWKRKLHHHRAKEISNPETDELGLRKINLGKTMPSIATTIKMFNLTR